MTSPDISAIGPGTLLGGRYTVVGRLGAGGMGTVFLATDATLGGRTVAVKVLTVADRDGQFLRRFRREAQIMARLRHPNLVEIYDVDLAASPPFIVLEYVEGSDLHTLACRGELFDGAQLRRLAVELAEALSFLHGSGIVHRDVKSGNVMLQPDGRARLMDLGLAHDADATQLTADDCFMGTIVAVPPEVVLGSPHSPLSDVFAWAIVVYRAATGCHPYMARDDADGYLQMVSRGRFPPVPDHPAIPADVMAVVHRSLAYDAAARPADGAALVALLGQRTAATASAVAPPAPGPDRTSGRITTSGRHETTQVTDSAVLALVSAARRRRRGPLAALAALGLVALVLMFARPSRVPREAPPPSTSRTSPLPPPRVRCSLDRVQLSLPPGAPATCLGRLMDAGGELLVERPFRDGRCLLTPPAALRGTTLTWAVSASGHLTVTGPATVGLRPVFEGLDPATYGRFTRSAHAMRLPPVVVGHRVLHALHPGYLAVLRRSSAPGPGLVLEDVLRPKPRPLRYRTEDGLPPRFDHPLMALTALGSDAALVVQHGLGARWSSVRSGTGTPDGPLELMDLGPAGSPGVEVIDALVVPLPGHRALAALDCAPPPDEPGPRRVVQVWRVDPSLNPPLTLVATVPGRTPLALAAAGSGSALLVHVEDEAVVARHLSLTSPPERQPGPWPLPSSEAPPAWRDGADADALALTASRVLVAVMGSLFLVDLPGGPPRPLVSPLPDLTRPLRLVSLGGGRFAVVGSRPAAPPVSIPALIDVAVVDAGGAGLGLSPPPLSVDTQLRLLPPLALLAAPDRLVVAAQRHMAEYDPRRFPAPAGSVVELSQGWLSHALMVDDLICLFGRSGSIFAYDPVEDDD